MNIFSRIGILAAVMLTAGASHAGTPTWIWDGNPVCTAANEQTKPRIASDGAGGVIIVWRDYRSGAGGTTYDIYAQRINAEGVALWTPDGVAVCTASYGQDYQQVVPDGSGGVIIAWQDARSYYTWDIYAQRIDATGAIQWTPNGVPLCTASYDQRLPQLVSDGTGGAIVVWEDQRSDSYFDIYAQRIGAGGSVIWMSNGIAVCTAANEQAKPQIAEDEAGGAIIVWRDYRSGASGTTYDIYAQRIDAAGVPLWTPNGVAICTASYGQDYQQVIPDGFGGAIIAWQDARSYYTWDIYAQRIDATGAIQWSPDGVPLCTASYDQRLPQLVSDGTGGAIVVFEDQRSTGTWFDIYAQRIDPSGSVMWTNDGIAVCTANNHQYVPQIASNGFGGAIVTWEDGRTGVDYNVFAQQILAHGVVGQWSYKGNVVLTPDGAQVCGALNDQGTPQIAADGVGGAMITWFDNRNGSTTPDIYAQSIYLGPVATQLQSYAAEITDGGVRITWSVSEIADEVSFAPMRSDGADCAFVELSPCPIERDGLSFSFVDESCEPGTTYWYRVDIIEGGERRTLFESDAVTIPPGMLVLHQNSPNPFNPSTVITYDIPAGCMVELSVYDVTGKLVRKIVEGYQAGGSYSYWWDGRNMTGAQVASGVYVYRLSAGKEIVSHKMVLLR